MYAIDFIFIAFCIYIPILTVIYIVEVWVILKPNSKFRGPFYGLFVASAICDIIFTIASFPEFRWAIYPIVNGNGMVVDTFALIRLYISFVCPPTQDFLNLFIAINRLTAISMPIKNKSIWKYLLPISITFSFVFSLIFLIPILLRRLYYSPVPMGDFVIYLGAVDMAVIPWFNAQIFCTVLELTIMTLTLVIYVRTSMLIKRVQIKKRDRKLLVFGIAVFVVNIPGITLQSLMGFSLFPRSILPVLYYNLAWVADVKSFSSPIIMIIVNDSFRRETLKSVVFWRQLSSSPASSVEVRSFSHRL